MSTIAVQEFLSKVSEDQALQNDLSSRYSHLAELMTRPTLRQHIATSTALN